jgi:carbon-monoxide dehydrogenase medium subunit
MKPVDFTLHSPRSVAEAVTLLAEHAGQAKVLAGGQSLVPLLNFRLARPEHLVDIGRIAGLARVQRGSDSLVVGAMVRQAYAERSPAVAAHAPLITAACPNIAHPSIRNRGTVGGSLAHADPAAELPAVARALDAVLVAAGPRGRREITAAEFFRGNLVTALDSDELLVEIRFAAAPFAAASVRTGAAFEEVGRRRGDFALVGAGTQLTVDDGGVVVDARICLTGVASVPHRATEAEDVLKGHRLTEHLLRDAAGAARSAISPSSDLHATAAYRKDVAGEMVRRSISTAHHRAMNTVAVAA